MALMLGGPTVLPAQTCTPPHPFDRTATIRASVAFVPGSGTACDVTASLPPNNTTPSGGFAWYSLPNPETLWRISFRVDASGFSSDDILAYVSILSVTSREPWPAVDGNADLFRVTLAADYGSDEPYIAVTGSCSGTSGCGQDMFYNPILSTLTNGDMLRFELSVGAGDAGQLRFWQNADFTDPPTAVFTGLNNAMWQGVHSIAIGAFNPYYHIFTSGASVHFYEIQTSDDILFWSDFDE